MKLFDEVKTGVFLSRPNRFVVQCRLSGNEITAYLPNPGKLRELLLPGAEVYLVEHDRAGRKLKFTVVAVKGVHGPVLLHTHMNNTVAAMLIKQGRIPGLERWNIVKAEHTFGRSRFDFLLSNGNEELILEVKSCTLFCGKLAMFPDAITSRGTRHLKELSSLAGRQRRSAVLFLVHSPGIQYFMPDYHTDPDFSSALLSVRSKVMVKAVSVAWTGNLRVGRRTRDLYIPWKLIRRESRDRGSYITVLRLEKTKKISVGKLGICTFKKGFYLYVGSARRGLTQRVARHQRTRKHHFWHIDYLREQSDHITSLPVRSSDDLECAMADDLSLISGWNIPHFGSSDCGCHSHLFGMDENPLISSAFINLVLKFRMKRLEHMIC